jgi:hypothetical protein
MACYRGVSKKMFSWLLLMLVSTFSASNISLKPSCSSNTSTFLVQNLNTRVEAIREVRDSKPHEFFMSVPVTQQSTPSYNPNRAPLPELNKLLLEHLEEEDNENLLLILDEMYADYPTVDHVNELYEDEKNGGSKTLLHFAIAASNTQLIDSLCIKYDLDVTKEDSFKYSALELAENLVLYDMTLHLIKNIRGIALVPFHGYESYIHYAAATDRVDLLRIIQESGFYEFEMPIPGARTSPLEFALFEDSFGAADYLINYNSFISKNALLLCYCRALDKLESDPNSVLFIISRFPILLYWKTFSGLDVMLIAIKNNLPFMVKYLFNFGYDIDVVQYNLYAEAAHLTDSFEILDIILAEMVIKKGIIKENS